MFDVIVPYFYSDIEILGSDIQTSILRTLECPSWRTNDSYRNYSLPLNSHAKAVFHYCNQDVSTASLCPLNLSLEPPYDVKGSMGFPDLFQGPRSGPRFVLIHVLQLRV